MQALTEKQRNFVLAMLSAPHADHCQWSRMAGYANSDLGHRVKASELLQNPKVRAAVFECSRGYLHGVGPALAAAGLLKIGADPHHRDHFRALESIADRVGLPKTTEHHVLVDDHRRDPATMIARVKQLAGDLGLDPAVLLAGTSPPAHPVQVIEHQAVLPAATDTPAADRPAGPAG